MKRLIAVLALCFVSAAFAAVEGENLRVLRFLGGLFDSGGQEVAVFDCEWSIAELGNQVRQLHIHIIARFSGDAAWPGPVWGTGPAVAYGEEQRNRLIAELNAALAS